MISGTESGLKKFYHGLSLAYSRVFERRSIYVEDVLVDLARFCKAHESTFHPDSHVQAMFEGRKQVWLRIMENIQLNADELYALHPVKRKE